MHYICICINISEISRIKIQDALKFIVLKISYYTVHACPYTHTVCYYTSSYHIVPYSYTYFIVTHCTYKQCHIGTNIAMWPIGGGKGGAMGLQPHLILRVLHRILIFYHRNIFFSVS